MATNYTGIKFKSNAVMSDVMTAFEQVKKTHEEILIEPPRGMTFYVVDWKAGVTRIWKHTKGMKILGFQETA